MVLSQSLLKIIEISGMGNYHKISQVCVCLCVCVCVCLTVCSPAPKVYDAAPSFVIILLSIVPSGSLLKMVEIG